MTTATAIGRAIGILLAALLAPHPRRRPDEVGTMNRPPLTAWQLANHHARRWSPAQDTLPTEQARP